MLDRFLAGFFDGISWLILTAIVIFSAILGFAPIALVICGVLSPWWLLSYFIVIPVIFGIWNVIN